MEFIKGKQPCWECAGTGQSPRGYGDSSPCGTCHATGSIRISRIGMIIDSIKRAVRGTFFNRHRKE